MTTAELAEALRPVIKEVVREAMQTELREILTEAVEIASRPDAGDSFEIEDAPTRSTTSKKALHLEKPAWVQELDAKEQKRLAEGKAPSTAAGEEAQSNAIMNLLGATAREMTPADKKNFA